MIKNRIVYREADIIYCFLFLYDSENTQNISMANCVWEPYGFRLKTRWRSIAKDKTTSRDFWSDLHFAVKVKGLASLFRKRDLEARGAGLTRLSGAALQPPLPPSHIVCADRSHTSNSLQRNLLLGFWDKCFQIFNESHFISVIYHKTQK